jgi:glycosyltransferase involved in cell wall biosynthesis
MSNPPNHIALFLPHLGGGGAERVMALLAAGFAGLGLRVDLVLVKAEGTYLSQIPPEVRLIDLHAANEYTSLPGLVRYLRRERPQVLCSTLDLASLIALIARRIARVSTRAVVRVANTVSMRKRSFLKKKLERLLLSWIYPWADNIIAVSEGVRMDLAEYTGISPERIVTIYNPVITPGIVVQAQENPAHPWFASQNIPVILGVGRLAEAKDFPTLLRAFAILLEKRAANLVILGEGDQRSKLERLAQELGIAANIYLHGFTANPFAYMSRAAVFALTSLWEGLPGVLIQAMACGCPVVSTDCPSGPSEILAEGKYGHLVPVGDVEKLAEALEQVLDGDKRLPPKDWLKQYELAYVLRQYLEAMGLESRQPVRAENAGSKTGVTVPPVM